MVEHETHISRLLSEQHAAEEQLRVARQVVNQHEEQMTHLLSTLNLPEVDIIKQCQKVKLFSLFNGQSRFQSMLW